VHVTLRMEKTVWSLRSQRCLTALNRAFWGGANRFGFKLVHYSVQGNHLHLLVEAQDERALSKGMNGLGVRIARGLNRVMQRKGKVLADRYHAHILRIPTEVRRVRNYLLSNARKYFGHVGPDPFTSTVALIAPDTFLLRRLC
jgi:putative transposase